MSKALPTFTPNQHIDFLSAVLNRELLNREERYKLQVNGYGPIEEIRAAIESVAALRQHYQ